MYLKTSIVILSKKILTMINSKFSALALGYALFMLTFSCSPRLTPLSGEMIKENGWSSEDLKHVQFYLANDLILSRRLSTGESTISNGKIRIRDGQKIEQIIIKSGTPGTLLFMPKEDRMAISFDDSSNDKYLIFGASPKMRSRFVLFGKEWDAHSGKITYNGQIYDTSSESAFNALLVDLKRASKIIQQTEVAQGRKIVN